MNTQVKTVVNRREFVAKLVAALPDALIVTGLGSPSYDVFAAGDRDKNFYLWGAMGGSTTLGLGLALAQPDKAVIVITGDGEQLMGVGALGTVGCKQPKNLTIVVLDNGHFGETGMQRSHSSLGTSLSGVAREFGIRNSFTVDNVAGVEKIAELAKKREECVFAQVYIDSDEPPRALPPRDGVFVKNRFRAALGLAPF